MAKILTVPELAEIVGKAPSEIDDKDQYLKFAADLAALVTDHFGGHFGTPCYVEEMREVTVAITKDENIPEGGGIYVKYDPEGEL